MTPQEKYQRQKMTAVNAKYKTEFVNEFKEACKVLGKTQSEIFREAMEQAIEKAKAMEESTMFNIEKMYNDETYFNQFIQELKDYDDFGKFKGYFGKVSDVEEKIDDLNTSCEIYTEVNGSYECACNDKEIHDEFGSDDDHYINGYVEVEVGYGKYVKLYGKYYCGQWNEDDEVYEECGFGDYYGIDLD